MASRRRFRHMGTARRQLQDAHQLGINSDSIMGVVYAERQAFIDQVQRMPPQQDQPWCAICHAALDEITDTNPEGSTIVLLRCGHEFHQLCLDPWVASPYSARRIHEQANGPTCPMCRAPLETESTRAVWAQPAGPEEFPVFTPPDRH